MTLEKKWYGARYLFQIDVEVTDGPSMVEDRVILVESIDSDEAMVLRPIPKQSDARRHGRVLSETRGPAPVRKVTPSATPSPPVGHERCRSVSPTSSSSCEVSCPL